jgi:hypothetical protein
MRMFLPLLLFLQLLLLLPFYLSSPEGICFCFIVIRAE